MTATRHRQGVNPNRARRGLGRRRLVPLARPTVPGELHLPARRPRTGVRRRRSCAAPRTTTAFLRWPWVLATRGHADRRSGCSCAWRAADRARVRRSAASAPGVMVGAITTLARLARWACRSALASLWWERRYGTREARATAAWALEPVAGPARAGRGADDRAHDPARCSPAASGATGGSSPAPLFVGDRPAARVRRSLTCRRIGTRPMHKTKLARRHPPRSPARRAWAARRCGSTRFAARRRPRTR